MSKTLAELVTAESVSWAYFIDVDWPNGRIFAHTRLGDIAFNNQIFQGVGDAGVVDSMNSTAKIAPSDTAILLTGIKSDLLGEVSNVDCRGRAVSIYIGFLNSEEEVVGSRLLFRGRISRPTISRGSVNTIRLELTSRLNVWNDHGNGRFTQACQQALHPGDNAFRYVNQLVGTSIGWGTEYNPPLPRK